MGRPGTGRGHQLAALLLYALLASALMAGATIAQEEPPPMEASEAQAPVVTDPEQPPAEQPPAEPPAEQTPNGQSPSETQTPSTTQTPAPPAAAPAVMGIGIEVAAPAAPGDAPAPGGAEAPSAQPAPLPSASSFGTVVTDALSAPVLLGFGGSRAVDAGEAGARTVSRTGKEADFQRNPCRDAPDSAECGEFLYPSQCDVDGRDYDEDFCAEFVATNPCARAPDSAECRYFTVSACFDRPFQAKCHFIRDAFFDRDNPCRTDKNSQACADYATQAQCDRRALSGVDCELFLLMLRSFTQAEADQCLQQQNEPFETGRPGAGSPCEVFISLIRRTCSTYPPPFGCYPLELGGTIEPIDDVGPSRDDDDDRPAGENLPGRGGDFVPAILDPGGDDGDADLEPVSDEGGDRDRRRPAARLARSGLDLGGVALLGLTMLAFGAGMRRLVGQRARAGE